MAVTFLLLATKCFKVRKTMLFGREVYVHGNMETLS